MFGAVIAITGICCFIYETMYMLYQCSSSLQKRVLQLCCCTHSERIRSPSEVLCGLHPQPGQPYLSVVPTVPQTRERRSLVHIHSVDHHFPLGYKPLGTHILFRHSSCQTLQPQCSIWFVEKGSNPVDLETSRSASFVRIQNTNFVCGSNGSHCVVSRKRERVWRNAMQILRHMGHITRVPSALCLTDRVSLCQRPICERSHDQICLIEASDLPAELQDE